MEPITPTPTPNQYDFITNSPAQPKKPLFGGSMKSRILIVGGIMVLLIVAASVISAVLSSAGQATVRNLKDVVAKQQELIRIAELGARDGMSVDARSFSKTVSLTLQTDQAKIIDMLVKNNGKLNPAERNVGKSSTTDKTLEAAKANNQYDAVLNDTLTKQLGTYMAALKTAHDGAKGQNTKEALSASYANAGILLKPAEAQQ